MLVSLAKPEYGCPLEPGSWEDRAWGLGKSGPQREVEVMFPEKENVGADQV